MPKTVASLLLLILAINQMSGAALHFQSRMKQVSLVELYTSEGCSSCPPAEAWLTRQKQSPELWKDFVPLAFHVDYWNYLGWPDRWSDASYSLRQSEYAKAWHSENIYTPCFVLNGQEWGSTFFRRTVPAPADREVGLLSVQSSDTNYWDVTFAPTEPPQGSYEVHAALLAGDITSDVKAGENAGRTLQHEFVVLNLVQIGLKNQNGLVKGKFILNAAGRSEKTLAIAVWITHGGELPPIQATGGWITAPKAGT
jgi:hypothetical protein